MSDHADHGFVNVDDVDETSTSTTTPTPPPTPTGRVSSIPNTTTTEPVTSTLPQTGSSGSGPLAGVSLVLIAVGGLLLLLTVRTSPDSSDSDT